MESAVQSLPHLYRVSASGKAEGSVTVSSPTLPDLATQPPPEFGGPVGYWSPETLLLAAVADCYLLSFRAVARASKLAWETLSCEVDGHLEKDDAGVVRFTRIELRPVLTLADQSDAARAEAVLRKAKRACLVSNSLNADVHLQTTVRPAATAYA